MFSIVTISHYMYTRADNKFRHCYQFSQSFMDDVVFSQFSGFDILVDYNEFFKTACLKGVKN